MTKADELRSVLEAGWCAAPSLCFQYHWQPHTLRGAISQINVRYHNAGDAKRVERKRENGVTFYRVSEVAAQ